MTDTPRRIFHAWDEGAERATPGIALAAESRDSNTACFHPGREREPTLSRATRS